MSRPSTARAALSIVVPAPGDAAALEATLVSVLENRPADCEIVVPLGFAYADPWGIGEEVRLLPAPPGSGLVSCTNVGIAASNAPVIHILAAGWLATPNWTDRPRELFATGDVQAVVPVGTSADAPDRIVSAGLRVTRGGRRVAVPAPASPAAVVDAGRLEPTAPVLEAGFWRADLLAAIGPGFAACCGDWLADADAAAALACLSGRVVLAAESRVVCGGMRRRPGAFAAGLQAERLFWRSLAAGGGPASLLRHVAEVVRDAVASAPLGSLPMLAGRLVAAMQFGDYASRLARLRELGRAESGDGAAILRIDESHESVARPSRRSAEPQPLRRSA